MKGSARGGKVPRLRAVVPLGGGGCIPAFGGYRLPQDTPQKSRGTSVNAWLTVMSIMFSAEPAFRTLSRTPIPRSSLPLAVSPPRQQKPQQAPAKDFVRQLFFRASGNFVLLQVGSQEREKGCCGPSLRTLLRCFHLRRRTLGIMQKALVMDEMQQVKPFFCG